VFSPTNGDPNNSTPGALESARQDASELHFFFKKKKFQKKTSKKSFFLKKKFFSQFFPKKKVFFQKKIFEKKIKWSSALN
jgi:hypothetical protein